MQLSTRRVRLPGLGQIPGSITGTLSAPAGSMPTPEHSKTQWIRLADIAFIGPGMIYAALRKAPPEWVRAGMMIAGIATIAYNLNNFLNIQKARQALLQDREV